MRGQWISTCLILLGVAGLAFGSWQLTNVGSRPIDVQPDPFDCGELIVNKTEMVPFAFRNHGPAPVQLVGAKGTCWASGCSSFGFQAPLTIPAGESREITLEFKPNGVGPFEVSFHVYSDAPAQPQIDLNVVGTIVASHP